MMARLDRSVGRLPLQAAAFALASAIAGGAAAQSAADAPVSTAPAPPSGPAVARASDLARIDADERAIAAQARQLDEQRAMLDQQRQEIEALKTSVATDLGSIRASGTGATSQGPVTTTVGEAANAGSAAPTARPVGEAPPPPRPATLALPPGINVLTRPYHLTLEPGLDYQNSGSDRLVFEGVEIVNALLIGVIEANKTQNNSEIAWANLYYGLAPRFELEASIPYVNRSERVTTVATAQSQLSQTFTLGGAGLGDVQMTGRYQITSGRPGEPILIANLTVKSNTGQGPYDVGFDSGGIAQTLPVGSGFWSVQPSLSWIYPSDPVVLFGNIGYLHSFGYNVNKTIGAAHVGEVRPGDGISAAVGFSFSVNPRFSYSLGFMNNYFFPTSTILTNVKGETTDLEDGALLVGGSYRLTNHLTLNLNFQFGVTPDAPNTTVLLRLPYVF